jgi:hypothetical protein
MTVEDVVDTVLVVERSTDGWAVLHPLWQPALRPLLSAEETVAVRVSCRRSAQTTSELWPRLRPNGRRRGVERRVGPRARSGMDVGAAATVG